MLRISSLCVLSSVLLTSTQSFAQIIACNDQTTPARQIWHVDATTGAKTLIYSGGTEASCWGIAYDPANNLLYWNNGGSLYKSPYSIAGLTPTLVGAMNIGGSSANVTGMAFDTVSNKLLGYRSITAPGFYEINTSTAGMSLVNSTPASTDFGGFDYSSPLANFYGLNDSTGLSGRGLYRINNMYGAPSYSMLAAYPGGDTDIDGLTTGNNRAFMINDTSAQPIYVVDLNTNSYLPSLPSPFTGTNGVFAGAAWVPEPSSILLLTAGLALIRRRH